MSPKKLLRNSSHSFNHISLEPDHGISVDSTPEDLIKRIRLIAEELKRLQYENASLKEKVARNKTDSSATKKELRGEALKTKTNFQFISALEGRN